MLRNANSAAIVPPVSDKRTHQHHGNLLRTPGLLGQWPLVGLLMVLMGGALFGVFAVNVQTNGPLTPADTQIVNSLHETALQSPPLTRGVMILGFYVGEQGVIAIGAILALYFGYRHYWPELGMVLIGWIGQGAIWSVLSQYFNRARPVFEISVWRQMPPPSFPSGHSFGAVMCFGLLAYLLVPAMPSWFWKVLVTFAAGLVILWVGFSRVFVGDHFPTDVLAGYALGILWAGFTVTLVELIARTLERRKDVNRQPAA